MTHDRQPTQRRRHPRCQAGEGDEQPALQPLPAGVSRLSR